MQGNKTLAPIMDPPKYLVVDSIWIWILKPNFVEQLFIGPELKIETNPKPYFLFNPPNPSFHIFGKK